MKAYKRNLRYLDNIEQKLCRTRDYGMTARTQLKKDEVSKMIKLFAVKYKNDKVLKNDKQYFESLNKEQECIEEKPKDKKIKIKGKKEWLASKNDSSTYAHSLQNLSESYVTIRQANMGAFDTKNMNHNKLVSWKRIWRIRL